MPKILLQAWENFFAIQHAQLEDTNKLFQKLLEDLQIINEELVKYINSPSWNHPTFFNDDEEYSVQYKEYLENSSDSDIRQLVRKECGINVCEEQKQNMEDTMLELIEVYPQKEFYYMYNDVDDLIESALNSKLLSFNLRSQHLDKKKQEVKNVVNQSTKHRPCILKSLQNFRVKKSSISLNNTSQISLVHAITPVLPTKEPVEYEVTSNDESECDVPVKDESSLIFTTFSNPIFDDNDDFTSSDDELRSSEDVPMGDFKVYSNFLFDDEEINSNKIDPHYFNAKFDLIESLSNRDTLFDSYSKFDYLKEFIESNDYDSGGDIYIFEELLNNDTPPIPKNESSNINHHGDPSFPRPPPEPPDVEVFFEPGSGVLTTNAVKGIS
uniref:Reverse transcriptase domain-containing protein n=1 Tax=Tanacetum cinerariifolium TaxID=118510 RepID=A0A6L2KUP0_TANCI|nr:hypothetical protein [Tanacetum cinerariifolium]